MFWFVKQDRWRCKDSQFKIYALIVLVVDESGNLSPRHAKKNNCH